MSELRNSLEVAIERAESFEAIPPITDPMGRNWQQPDRREILIDDTHAVMTTATFNALAEYSCTNPSGAYEGKMWKRHDGAFDRAYLASGGKPEWKLVWYGRHLDPAKVSINHRLILIADVQREDESR
jgi:hypothetical protein